MQRIIVVLAVLFFTSAQRANAYPGYIGFGYGACLTCHFNPAGNGALSDYGRALSASEISARLLTPNATDEEVSANSGFLGPFGTLPDWLRLQYNYRGLVMVGDLQDSAATQTTRIPMQNEIDGILKFMDDQLVVYGDFGTVPDYRKPPGAADYISRNYWASYRISKSIGVYAGKMDTVFGLRVPDHNAFIRSMTGLNYNDQTHGVLLHATDKKYDAYLHLQAGNLESDASTRQGGASASLEYELLPNFRLGGSLLATGGSLRKRQLAAVTARLGVGSGSSVIAELGLVRTTMNGKPTTLGDVYLLQSMTRLTRGLYVLMTVEHFAADLTSAGARVFRVGPSLNYFPFQRLELRADFLGTRTTGTPVVTPDYYQLAGQVHVWL